MLQTKQTNTMSYSRIVLIKNAIKCALAKQDLFVDNGDDDMYVTIFNDITTVDLPVFDSSGYQKETTCYKGDMCIVYNVYINGANNEVVMAKKTLIVHAKKLGYDLEQIKRLCLIMTNQNDECIEHFPYN